MLEILLLIVALPIALWGITMVLGTIAWLVSLSKDTSI